MARYFYKMTGRQPDRRKGVFQWRSYRVDYSPFKDTRRIEVRSSEYGWNAKATPRRDWANKLETITDPLWHPTRDAAVDEILHLIPREEMGWLADGTRG